MSTLVNNRILISIVNFELAFSNVNVKISDLLEFLVMLLFSPFVLTQKSFVERLHYYKNIHGGDAFLIS